MSEETGRFFYRLHSLSDLRPGPESVYTDRAMAERALEAKAKEPEVIAVWLEECRVVRKVHREPGA